MQSSFDGGVSKGAAIFFKGRGLTPCVIRRYLKGTAFMPYVIAQQNEWAFSGC
jgi:hypothetical protein